VESESKEVYLGFLRLFKIVCPTFQKKSEKYYIGDGDRESGKGLEGTATYILKIQLQIGLNLVTVD